MGYQYLSDYCTLLNTSKLRWSLLFFLIFPLFQSNADLEDDEDLAGEYIEI